MPRKPPGELVPIEGGKHAVKTPQGLDDASARLFRDLVDELRALRGAPLPADIEMLGIACHASRMHQVFRRLAEEALTVDLDAASKFSADARKESQTFRAALVAVGLGSREAGTKRSKLASARLGAGSPTSKWGSDLP